MDHQTAVTNVTDTLIERRNNAIRRLAELAEEPTPDGSESPELREVLVLEMLAKMLDVIDRNFTFIGCVPVNDDSHDESEGQTWR